ncbi:hypothetical protein ACHAXS_003546 [Conticribra weissflogii]
MMQSHDFSILIAARALAASTLAYLEPQSRGLTFTAYNSIVNDALLPPFSVVVDCGGTDRGEGDADDNAAAHGNETEVGGPCRKGNEEEDYARNGWMDGMSERDNQDHVKIDERNKIDPGDENLKDRFNGCHEIKEIYDRSGKQTVRCLCAVVHSRIARNHSQGAFQKQNDAQSAERIHSFVPPAISITFRGTDTLENVLADVKAHRVSFGNIPKTKVHAGFRDAWYGDRMRTSVLEYVCKKAVELAKEMKQLRISGYSILSDEDDVSRGAVTIDIVGHSLGGSMAVLAAYDIAQTLSTKEMESFHHIRVYTLGCPRVGNVRFAKAFNDLVPDCWNVINSNDIVPAIPYSHSLPIRAFIPCRRNTGYRRHGRAVILSENGDLIVEPTRREKYRRETRVLRLDTAIKSHETARYRASIRKAIQKERETLGSKDSSQVRRLGSRGIDNKEKVLGEFDDLLARLEDVIHKARSDPTRSIRMLPGAT